MQCFILYVLRYKFYNILDSGWALTDNTPACRQTGMSTDEIEYLKFKVQETRYKSQKFDVVRINIT